MNIRTFTFAFALALLSPCVAMAAQPDTPTQGQTKAPITPSCNPYILSGEWIYNLNDRPEWTLSIKPSPCGYYIDDSEFPMMFYEILQKWGQSLYWANNWGMMNQLLCHLHTSKTKPEWNLEPFRPYVGYDATRAAGCNPTKPLPGPVFK